MGIESYSPKIKMLLLEVENIFGKKPSAPSDFISLAYKIKTAINQQISSSTLERVWNYSTRISNTISVHTLNILCEYAGKNNWQSFSQDLNECGIIDSEIADGFSIKSDTLSIGDRLQIEWLPDRKCIIEYLGDYKFKAVKCENSTLQPNDTFKCIEFIRNQPAVMDEFIQAKNPDEKAKRYIAGKYHGISIIKKLKS